MALDVGVNVREVDGRSSPAIQGAPTSVAAFLGLARRGVPNREARVTTLAQFQARFGGHRADSFMAYAVEGFFLNGGREAHITRVVGAGSTPAATTLNNRVTPTAGPSLRIAAGYRGSEDPGDWGTNLRLDISDDPRGSTMLVGPTVPNATTAVLASLEGFQVGSVVRFVDGVNVFFRQITGITPGTRTIEWQGAIGPVLAAASTQVTTAEFRLVVRYRERAPGDFVIVEDWRNLSMVNGSADYAPDRINHAFAGSRYITATDLSGAAGIGVEGPAIVSNRALTGGVENASTSPEFAGNAAQHTGFFAFDTVQVQLLAVPDAHCFDDTNRDIVVRAALDYCAARGDCMFVGSAPDRSTPTVAPAPPSGVTPPGPARRTPRALSDYTQLESDYVTRVKAYSAAFQASKVFGALYAPWGRIGDPLAVGPTPARFIPLDGHIMGVYARVEQAQGIWKAPAGNAAQVRGVLEPAAAFTDGQHTDLVRNGLLNGVRRQPGAGIIVAASRTLSTDTRWWFVNVRLLFNFVKSSLRDGLRFVRQEPHSGELRRRVALNVVRPFLLGLWRRGAFGSDPPDQVFSIKCDAENNPPAQVDLGIFTLEVYFYPVKPVETILIIVGQQPSGASAGEG